MSDSISSISSIEFLNFLVTGGFGLSCVSYDAVALGSFRMTPIVLNVDLHF